MPDLPLLIYDGKCGFCKVWIDYWKQVTTGRVEYAPSQEVGGLYPQIPPDHFKRSVQFVEPDGSVYQGAEAVFRSLAVAPETSWWLWLYRHVPGFALLSEIGYRFVADHRDLFYHVTKWTFGMPAVRSRYESVTWLFLRVLALVYMIAFTSLLIQVRGLIGSNGVLPAADFLQGVTQYYGTRAHWMVPSLFWWNAGDAWLVRGCWAGLLAALLLLFNVLPRVMLAILFALYLSYISVGQSFFTFQWDLLLTETGFLALFLGTSRIIVWLFRWLLFRLNFLSAAVKLLSGDVAWRSWQALRYHYETQPLPTPLAWYAHHLPAWFQAFSTLSVLMIEGLVAFLVFAPRRIRRWSLLPLAGLQLLILLTGNYGFFNWLTLALCLFLLDDACLPSWLWRWRLRERETLHGRWAALGPATLLLILTSLQVSQTFGQRVPAFADAVMTYASPFGIANSYGLFAVMTTERPELVIEGSADGKNWQPYEFRYKPGDVRRAPPWVAPHMPRLDWQMWFAALGEPRREAWLLQLLARLLQDSADVTKLFVHNPFPQQPPAYVRVKRYLYNFSAAHPDWWVRREAGEAIPAIGLRR